MTDPTDLLERAWDALSRWAVPVMMTLAYTLLAATSDTDATGKAWMSAGLALVLIAWFVFRALTASAALSRALAVGDTARLVALADRQLARRRRPAARAPYLIARGLAHLLRGELAEALAALDAAAPAPALQPLALQPLATAEALAPDLQLLATTLRTLVLVELGRPVEPLAGRRSAAEQGTAVARRAPWLAWLTDGAIAWRDGRPGAASPLLARVVDDIRAGGALRAIAHLYAARIAEASGDTAAASHHRAAAASLASPDAAWLRSEASGSAKPIATQLST